MNKKKLMVMIAASLVVGGGIFYFVRKKKKQGGIEGEAEETNVEAKPAVVAKEVKVPLKVIHGQTGRKDGKVHLEVAPSDKDKLKVGDTVAVYGGKYSGQTGKISGSMMYQKTRPLFSIKSTGKTGSMPLLGYVTSGAYVIKK